MPPGLAVVPGSINVDTASPTITIDLAASTAGNHTIAYIIPTIPGAGGCDGSGRVQLTGSINILSKTTSNPTNITGAAQICYGASTTLGVGGGTNVANYEFERVAGGAGWATAPASQVGASSSLNLSSILTPKIILALSSTTPLIRLP